MCYMGCSWESYPRGPNEGCVCRLPRGYECPMNIDDEDEIERINDEMGEGEEEG